jgi:hypothetical protein
LSGADPRPRHRPVSHHTRTVLELLLAGVEVPLPEGEPGVEEAVGPLLGELHRSISFPAETDRYADSGLPARTMGRDIADDPLFFAAALASGRALAARAKG